MQPPSHYEVSTDRSRLDVALIHEFLHSSYWAKGISREIVERSIDNSLCFGAVLGDGQVGFARVISDFATFAYVADVFVLPEHRARGVAKLLMRTIFEHPDLQSLRRLLLITRDAHGLYAQCGFEPLPNPENFMTVHRPDVYREEKAF